jgi:imidazole glycerol-phosphate synthase subunit HisF
MLRTRVIPVLLLQNNILVKSVNFKKYNYIGDPINAIKIFNWLKADELVLLDITATKEKRLISLDLIREAGEETDMPLAAGGGITSMEQVKAVINAGAEKVVINSAAVVNPDFIKAAADAFGSSAIIVCIDVKKKRWGGLATWIYGGTVATKYTPAEFAVMMQDKGAGEIIIQSIERDGMMNGYDTSLIKSVTEAVTIPVIALGGAGNTAHLKEAYDETSVNGLAAGSLFVYQSAKKGVLINYIDKKENFFYNKIDNE